MADPVERRTARVEKRERIAQARLLSRELQGRSRIADSFAKLGGGSLLTATLLLMVNGQVTWPVTITSLLALLVFVTATMLMLRLDRQIARLDHQAEIIEAALKETER